jgi:hypothetical protein
MALMRSKSENDPNDAAVRFVIGELDKALSLLHVAGTSFAIEKRNQCCRDAETAYATAQGFLPQLPLTGSQEAVINAMQRQIKLRLDRLDVFG